MGFFDRPRISAFGYGYAQAPIPRLPPRKPLPKIIKTLIKKKDGSNNKPKQA